MNHGDSSFKPSEDNGEHVLECVTCKGLKKQGGALKIKQTFYNQEHILYPTQALQVSHPSRQRGVAGAKLIILQFNFGVEQQCKTSGLLNPANNVL